MRRVEGLAMLAAWLGAACAACGSEWVIEDVMACPGVVPFRVESTGFALDSIEHAILPRVDDGVRFTDGGLPDVPFLVKVIAIPEGCDVRVEFVRADAVDTNGVTAAPVATRRVVEGGEGATLVAARDSLSEVYSADAFWPEAVLEVNVARMGTQRWARVVAHAVQVNPVTHVLRWNQVIEGRLVLREASGNR